MEGARPPSPGETVELSVLDGQPNEQTPLNGLLIQPCSAEDPSPVQASPSPVQANKESPWSSCNKTVVGKCKLWMVIASVFLGLIIVIILGLCLAGVTYIDEDENEIPELTSNKTFFIMLKIPEECDNEEDCITCSLKGARVLESFSFQLDTPGKREPHLGDFLYQTGLWLTDMYSESPSLSRYFTSAAIVDFSVENATVTYHLQFGVPSADDQDDSFMKYMMSEELVLGILLQNFHDQSVPSCDGLGLDPESLLLYE